MSSTDLAATAKSELLPKVGEKLGIQNLHAIPQIDKVKVSVGIGKLARKGGSSNSMDDGIVAKISNNLATITNQKPRTHLSKKAISNFKLREGMVIGVSVTLRGNRALDFINKLVNIALPRVRDFRGIPLKSFDGSGNYSLGIKDFTVFPEVKPEDADLVHGIEVTVCTTADSDKAAKELLTQMGFPFQKDTSREEAAEAAKKQQEEEAQKAAEEAALEAGLTQKEEPKPEEGEEGEGEPKEGDAKPKEDDSKKDDQAKDSKK
jgi:large subunit ribosomal protein L5